ncbi:MAG TPA: PIN domain-containing protein [Candidatus Acidoferrum sp.]
MRSSRAPDVKTPAIQASAALGATAAPPATAWEPWLIRASLAVAIGALCFAWSPFALHGAGAAGAGFLIALVILLAELRLRHASLSGLVGAVCGAIAGIFASFLLTLIISRSSEPASTDTFLEIVSVLGLTYLGSVSGIRCGAMWDARASGAVGGKQAAAKSFMKLLDTSVLIDGRIAEICEAHFLDGVLAVPQFVLHELQLVADSSDPLKRQRGRRGLEVLQRIQKMPDVEVRVLDQDFPQINDVDHKLIELARSTGAKIVTNDFNLNKVATVQGFCVLNVNELANALKPVVLPGETMHVLIQREGKEAMQGVAYLSDGTMVVVDGARRMINKTVDIIVTSVHQTTAGKMIFGRVDERSEPVGPLARAAAAGRSVNSGAGTSSSSNGAREDGKSAPLDIPSTDQAAPTANSDPETRQRPLD